MKKILLLTVLFCIGQIANSELLYGGGYISPERYAVNEADMEIDYSKIPPAPQLDVDKLEDMRFQAPNIVEKDIQIGEQKEDVVNSSKKNSQKGKKVKNDNSDEAYKKKLSYKFAKWWVDKRYQREEAHHGSLHEIKIQKRVDYEKSLEE